MVYQTKKKSMVLTLVGLAIAKASVAACVTMAAGCSQVDQVSEAEPTEVASADEKARRNRNGSTPTPVPTPVVTATTAPPVVASTTGSAPALDSLPGSTIGAIKNPILFVTQVPMTSEFGSRVATFANHQTSIKQVPRGGDLMIRYPDGTVRNLTKEAGFGQDGLQGANAIAVREPSVHWNGTKALFSMLVGAPKQYDIKTQTWQIYEISGLGKGETAKVTKVLNQPLQYNNVSPIYGTDEKVLFTSDRPRNGAAHLYPQLDEYESTPTNTGIWSLEPTSGALTLLVHSVSGSFSPTIDSTGRVIYTRWDHLLQDQQADLDRTLTTPRFGAFDFPSEAASTQKLPVAVESFPEPRAESMSAYGRVSGLRFNQFTPWQVNEDGTDEETLNHVGRQEFNSTFISRTFMDDPALSDSVTKVKAANQFYVTGTGGIFQVREDPTKSGRFFGIYAPEFASLSSGVLMAFDAPDKGNPENLAFKPVSPTQVGTPHPPGGRFRNPLPLSDGQILASYTPVTNVFDGSGRITAFDMRLRQLVVDKTTGLYSVMSLVTGTGVQKSLSWYDPDALKTWSGTLWELEPVEVVARQKPVRRVTPLATPESQVFAEEGVDPAVMQAWLKKNELALIVTRNQTSRDLSDQQQPFNLQVPGGTKTLGQNGGKVYNISNFQVFQADQIRGYNLLASGGRRPIATPMHSLADKNLPNPGGPAGSVKIAADGSTAVIVPAQRALAWQTTDSAGNAVVRERLWVSFQSGEIRVCASCHGVNSKDQAGAAAPMNRPEALRDLLKLWKTLPK